MLGLIGAETAGEKPLFRPLPMLGGNEKLFQGHGPRKDLLSKLCVQVETLATMNPSRSVQCYHGQYSCLSEECACTTELRT